MTPTPRKARSGRRQFGPGTDQEWAKVMAQPHIQRALADPVIGSALMQHLAQTAPPAPPAPGAPPAMKEGGAIRLADGGTTAVAELNTIAQKLADPNVSEADKAVLRARQATITSQLAQPSPINLGGTTVSSGTMGGVDKLAGQGPPTLANTGLAAGLGAMAGAGSTSKPALSALVSAGLAGGLNYLIRKYGKGAQQNQPQGGGGGGYGGGTGNTGGGGGGITTNQEPNLARPAGGPAGGAAVSADGVTEVPSAEAWNKDWKNQPGLRTEDPEKIKRGLTKRGPVEDNAPGSKPPDNSNEPSAPQEGREMRGTGNSDSGNLTSWDAGKTWKDARTGRPYTDTVLNQTQIDPVRAMPDMSAIGDAPSHLPDLDAIPYASRAMEPLPGLSGLGDLSGFAEGGPVDAPPSGLRAAIPVLHTTIVIADKPKGDKKDDKPKKKLLPPEHGPTPYGEERPKKHGRVQVPRGFGAAIKGKRFGGIF